MRERFNFYYIFSLFIFLSIASCKDKKNLASEADLVGNWIIYDATRNGRPTSTLKDGYITLTEENILETNILGTMVQAPFTHNGDQLISTDPFPYEFTIKNLSQDSLHLNGSMRSFNMNFYLLRVDSLPMRDSTLMN